jgi:hypothetical protein
MANGRFVVEASPAGVGHFRSSKLPEDRTANDRFPSTAAFGRRLLEWACSPKQPLTALLP